MKALKEILTSSKTWLLLLLVSIVTAAAYKASDVLANRFIVRKDGSVLGTNVTMTLTNSVFTLEGSTANFSVPATGVPTYGGAPGVSVTLTNAHAQATTNRLTFSGGILVSNTVIALP